MVKSMFWLRYAIKWNVCAINTIICSNKFEIIVISWTSSSPFSSGTNIIISILSQSIMVQKFEKKNFFSSVDVNAFLFSDKSSDVIVQNVGFLYIIGRVWVALQNILFKLLVKNISVHIFLGYSSKLLGKSLASLVRAWSCFLQIANLICVKWAGRPFSIRRLNVLVPI